MRKKTVKTLMTAFIVVFMISSIFFYGSQKTEEKEIRPEKLIYFEELPEEIELSFVKQGFTVARLYYPPLCVKCASFTQELENAVVNKLDKQMILEKIEVESFNKTMPYLYLKSLKSVKEIEGIENMSQFYKEACNVLLQQPPECILT